MATRLVAVVEAGRSAAGRRALCRRRMLQAGAGRAGGGGAAGEGEGEVGEGQPTRAMEVWLTFQWTTKTAPVVGKERVGA